MTNRTSVLIALLIASCLIAGCGGGGGGGGSASSAGPSISNLSVSPTNWSSGGGTATIAATVTAASGVSSVTASVTSSSSTRTVTLSQVSGAGLFNGTYAIPANTAVGGSAAVYTIVISATDAAGASSTASAGVISVPAPTNPPQPPISGS